MAKKIEQPKTREEQINDLIINFSELDNISP